MSEMICSPFSFLSFLSSLKFVCLNCWIKSACMFLCLCGRQRSSSFMGAHRSPSGDSMMSAAMSWALVSVTVYHPEPINVPWQPFVTLSYRGYCRCSEHKHWHSGFVPDYHHGDLEKHNACYATAKRDQIRSLGLFVDRQSCCSSTPDLLSICVWNYMCVCCLWLTVLLRQGQVASCCKFASTFLSALVPPSYNLSCLTAHTKEEKRERGRGMRIKKKER